MDFHCRLSGVGVGGGAHSILIVGTYIEESERSDEWKWRIEPTLHRYNQAMLSLYRAESYAINGWN